LASRRPNRPTGVPPVGERRYVADEVIVQLYGHMSSEQIDAFARRRHLTSLESQRVALTGATLYRWQITDHRSVPLVTAQLSTNPLVSWAQPNYLYSLAQDSHHASEAGVKLASDADTAQYAVGKLHLSEAHKLAAGDGVLVAVIDSGIDSSHPELTGAISGEFDAVGSDPRPHRHGTAVAGTIAAHAQLTGAAPAAHVLAVRAFEVNAEKTEGTTFNIIKGLDWAVSQNARIANMSFSGPADPLLDKALQSAFQRGTVLVAAAGNAGPKSPPVYPAADPNVIAVTATDADDHVFAQANRGGYVAVAAPGVDILVPTTGGGYDTSSGTSFAAAYISGIVALMLQHAPHLQPEAAKRILLTTAKDLGAKGRDDEFGAGLADAYQAVLSAESRASNTRSPVPAMR
jgi:subtilisin family serine protease